jgi:hypothetical protein
MLDVCIVRDTDEEGCVGTQYGDVFTFILFGRKVTVALGTQGNNFVLGGKVAHFSAEDAYKVRGLPIAFPLPSHARVTAMKSYPMHNLSDHSSLAGFESTIGCHGSSLWRRCCL